MKICLIASGGDAPGMNAFCLAFINYAKKFNHQVVASIKGYVGLIENQFVDVNKEILEGHEILAGCVFKCGRSKEFITQQGFDKALSNIKNAEIDVLVAMGGNGTFEGLERLSKAGVKVIGIPATIDNDLFYTSFSLGFASACDVATKMIDNIKISMETNNRNHMCIVMGRTSGMLAVHTAVATGANAVVIPENLLTPAQVVAKIQKANQAGDESAMVIILDTLAEDGKYEAEIRKNIDKEFRVNNLGFLQRGAVPTYFDRFLANNFAVQAVDLINVKKFGLAVGRAKEEFFNIKIADANKAKCKFNKEYYDLLDKINN